MKNFILTLALLGASYSQGMAHEAFIPAVAQQSQPSDSICCKAMVRHPWAGKRVGFIGDSITDPNCYGNEIKKFWSFLEEWLGITPYVYGVSGRQWNDAAHQAEQLKSEHGNEVDGVIVFLGTNDFNSGVPVGEFYTESEEEVMAARGQMKKMVLRKKRTLVMDDTTLKGRINIGMAKLKSLYPDKQIVLLTPLHRSIANFGDKNVQPDERYQNMCGEYIDAYVNAVKEAGNVWGVPVIDFNSVSGLNPMVEEQLIYFHDESFDRLHPNTAGQERMARTLMYGLLSLPTF
jgi:lysophospholipase L1-like esterase